MAKARVVKQVKDGISLLDNGKYLIVVRPWGTHGPKKQATRRTVADAVEERNRLLSLGNEPPERKKDQDKRLLSDLVEEWFDLHGQTLDDGEGTKGRLLKLINGYLGDMVATKLTGVMFGEARKKLLKDGLTPAAVNRHHAHVRAMFNTLMKFDKWNHDNPVAGIPQLKEVQAQLTYLDADERRRLINACKHSRSPHILLMIMLALATGGRWSEIYGLKRSHIKGNKVQFIDTKNDKRRVVVIRDELAAAVHSHTPFSRDALFPKSLTAYGEVVKRSNIKLPKGQLTHVLRHTFAVNFMEEGGSIHTLQRILGHSEITTTAIYLAFAPDTFAQMLELNPLVTDGINVTEKLEEARNVGHVSA